MAVVEQQCKNQIPEFHACKMIFEWHIGDTARDPDLAAVQFDDLKKASTAKSSRAEIQILHSASGGIHLCYRLMSTMMLVMVKIIYVVEMAEWDFKNCLKAYMVKIRFIFSTQ